MMRKKKKLQPKKSRKKMIWKELRGMTYDKVRPIFEKECQKVQTLFKNDKDVEKPTKKRVAEETLLQEGFKKLKAVKISASEFKVKALQVKYPLIVWEIHSEGSRSYWKIIRVGGITEAYQSFKDMLKGFDRDDLVALWSLVKEKFSSTVPNVGKEKALWVELKRLFEPDVDDVIWKLQREELSLVKRSHDPDAKPSLATRKSLTQKEAEREAIAIDICRRYSILEEERPVIETMAYSDKYKKLLDEICLDKMKLDGEMKEEEEEAKIRIKGEALIEKEDPRAFVILIRLEAKINLNALADTGFDINVGVTAIIAKFLILDLSIDRDTPILVGRGFLYTCGRILNTIEMITSTFDGIYHQTFRAAKPSLDTVESDSDNEEDYGIQRNNFRAPMYGSKHAKYLNCHDQLDSSIVLQEVLKICVWKKVVNFLGSLLVALQHLDWKPEYMRNYWCNQAIKSQYNTRLDQLLPRLIYSPCVVDWNVLNQMGCGEAIDEMLIIKLFVASKNEEMFTSEAWTNAFNINEPIYSELCHKFYSTYEFNEVYADDDLRTKKIIKFRLCGRAFSWTLLEFAKRLGLYHSEEIEEEGLMCTFKVLNSLSASIYFRALDATTHRVLTDSMGKLILEVPELGVPKVAIPRPLRASM
nr:hypothetical protein [Tanacetum cinerariifolium]